MNESTERFPREFDKLYSRIYGGISWPGKRPGYICIVGERRRPGEEKFVLLDENEDFDTEQLIAMAGGMDYYYKPERWLAGQINKATLKMLIEFNKVPDDRKGNRRLRLSPSRLQGLDRPQKGPKLARKRTQLFTYVYPKLKRMVGDQGELDISRGKMLLSYLSIIQDSDIAATKYGDYPSLEALAFAITDLEVAERTKKKQTHVVNDYERY